MTTTSVVNPLVKLSLSAYATGQKAGSVRGNMVRAILTAFRAALVTDAATDVSEFVKAFLADAREQVRATYGEAVHVEIKLALAGVIQWDRDGMGQNGRDVSTSKNAIECNGRVTEITARGSEAKIILAAFVAGHPSAIAFSDAKGSASACLASLKPVKVKPEASEPEATETESPAPFTLAMLAAMFAAGIVAAKKAGFTDAEIAATVAGAVTVPATV